MSKKKVVVKNKKAAPKKASQQKELLFKKENYLLMAGGAVLVLLGILLMSGGAQEPTEWNVDEIYSSRRTILAPIVILSGLYGALRPLDLIQPYRLELGAKYSPPGAKNLYQYWKEQVNEFLGEQMSKSGSRVLINLASEEYSKIVDSSISRAQILTIGFREFKNGKLRFMSFHAKKARGLVARHIIEHRISDPGLLKGFDTEGYSFSEEHSSEDQWIFIR